MPFSRCSSNDGSLRTFEKFPFKKKRIRSRLEYSIHKYSHNSEIHLYCTCLYAIAACSIFGVFSAGILHMDLNGLLISYPQNSVKIIAVEKDVVFVALKYT